MSDIFDEVISRLKQEAKSGGFIMILVAHNHRRENNRKWVRLENVIDIIHKLKQNYVLVKKPVKGGEDETRGGVEAKRKDV